MNDVPFKCLMGLSNCAGINPLEASGVYVRWFEILSLVGIVLAISAFIESNLFRSYIFKRKRVTRLFYGLIFFSVLSVIISTVLTIPLIPSNPIPFLSYPAFWEILSLFSFSFAVIGITFVSISPNLLMPKFNRRGYKDVWNIALNAVLYDTSPKAMAALSRVVLANFRQILFYARKYDRSWNIKGSEFKSPFERHAVKEKDQPVVEYAVNFLDELLSHKAFCQYISQRNLELVSVMVSLAEKAQLWHSCGFMLYRNLFKALFEDEESLLSQELSNSGIAYSKPLSSFLFRQFAVIANYQVFPSYELSIENLRPETVNKICYALKITIVEYFKKPRIPRHGDNPDQSLSTALRSLSQIIDQICGILTETNQEHWQNIYRGITSQILYFFDRLPNSFPKGMEQLCEEDQNFIKHNSLTDGLLEAIFHLLEGLSWLKNASFARHQTAHLFWILYSDRDNEFLDKLQGKLFEMVKERIEENKKQAYPSLIRLLLSVYGFEFPSVPSENLIGYYVQNTFYGEIAPLALENEEAAKYFLPSNWTWNLTEKIIITEQKKQVFPIIPTAILEKNTACTQSK